MDDFWRLTALSLAMFFGCYLAGSIPLALSLSESLLRRVTTFGAGLLIGTALIVIIPEGVEALYSEGLEHQHTHRAPHAHPTLNSETAMAAINAPDFPGADDGGKFHDVVITAMADSTDDHGEGEGEEKLQTLMGLSLLLGFIFMLFVDQVGGGHSHTPSSGGDVEVGGGTRHRRHNLTATIGLVVHAAADGLALGAAAGLSKVDVQLIIFLAIMLHKAPAAFGFTSFLIHEGYDKTTAKRHLLVFALAAPLAAFLSYFGLVRVMYVVQLPITGVAMLFSAGTFLYVATVHVLNELVQGHGHATTSSGDGTSRTNTGPNKLSHLELLMLTVGALLPLTFSVLHSH